jgi:hypothetical protein
LKQSSRRVEQRRLAIRAYHQAVIAGIDKPKGLAAAQFIPPSIDEEAIEEHLEQCRQSLLGVSRRLLIEGRPSLITMIVTNPGDALSSMSK